MLSRMLIASSANKKPSVTYITTLTDTASATTYTFTGVSVGSPSITRKCILTVHTAGNLDSAVAESCTATVNGNPATVLTTISTDTRISEAAAFILIINLPTGNTADIVVTFNQSTPNCAVSVYSATNLTSNTPQATATDSTYTNATNTLSVPVTGTTAGIVIAAATANFGSSTPTLVWSNVTENVDEWHDSSARYTSASVIRETGGTQSVSVTTSDSSIPTRRWAACSVYLG